MPELRGLATGIGSMPHTKNDFGSALELIFKYAPHIPFWPQFPKRGEICEGMVMQFSENLPCLSLNADSLIYDQDEIELEGFYDKIINQDVEYFQISKKCALGLYAFHDRLAGSDLKNIEFIKCQITGPFTFAAGIKDKKGRGLLYNTVFMQVVIKGLIMKALWQIKVFERFGKKIIMFLDEPYLGCFGSAYTPLNRENVVKHLTEVADGIKSEKVLVGAHCCGNTDWSIFTDVKSIDIINFDAFSYMDKFVLYAHNLNNFLKRGGIICWGVVPTQEFTGCETADSLVNRIQEGVDTLVKKGVDRGLLLNNLIISPACGMGTLDAKKAKGILELLSQTSHLIRKNPG